jgi:hypothetical protein
VEEACRSDDGCGRKHGGCDLRFHRDRGQRPGDFPHALDASIGLSIAGAGGQPLRQFAEDGRILRRFDTQEPVGGLRADSVRAEGKGFTMIDWCSRHESSSSIRVGIVAETAKPLL